MLIFNLLKKHRFAILSTVIILSLVGIIEYGTGRSLLGPDGRFGWWDGNIWGSENSQRVADVYSFSHIIHGIIFYAFLWVVARRLPLKYRFVIALIMEAAWELLENSPIIIDRYRNATIAQGYVGDSVLNSICDILMVVIGFLIARFSKIWLSIMLIIIMELGCLFWVRDNLTLNVVMLVHPVESIKEWQSEGYVIQNETEVVKKYITNNIKTIATDNPVLGGSWYVVDVTVDQNSDSGEVVYEDGHIQSKAKFTYSIKNSVLSITSFIINP